jgi:RimJ/RimL family protein N-acetyltransferase
MYSNIKSDSLILDRFTIEDAPTVQKLANDEETSKLCLLPHPYPDGAAEAWINSQEEIISKDIEHIWAIRVIEDKELIGSISLKLELENDSAEIGFWLGSEFHNLGIGRIAVKELVKHAFENYNLNKIYARCFSRNYPAIRVLELCGFQPEGRLRKHLKHRGEFEDLVIMGCLLSDYQKRNANAS